MTAHLRLVSAAAVLAALVATGEARADENWTPRFFHQLYGDFSYTSRYGPATFDQYRAGLRVGPFDAYPFAKYDWADTHYSAVPTPYAYNGVVLGGGLRAFLFERSMWIGAELGRGVTGTRKDQNELRVGGAGWWDHDDQVAGSPRRETYADAFYIKTQAPVNDVFFYARHRQGWLIAPLLGGFAWGYGVVHLNLSGKDNYGADNRAEGGVGLGWRAFWGWHESPLMPDTVAGLSVNAEFRGGAILRGSLAGMNREYVTPFLVASGGFLAVETKLHVMLVFGTRPEAVKLFPVIRKMRRDSRFRVSVVVTGQHREMLDEILQPFGIEPDVDLAIMKPGQTLNQIVTRVVPRLDALYEERKPDMILVQGDTTSAFCAALAAFHRRIPIAHLEAGLRTFDRFNPYPEEANRRMVSAIADLHLAPTTSAADCLVREGIARDSIVVTGNTVVDALLAVLGRDPIPESTRRGRRMVLVTLHRREAIETTGNDGESLLDGLLRAIRDAAIANPNVDFVYPVHMNPRVRAPVERVLAGVSNVELIEPQPYVDFTNLMSRATIVVSDSGGVQEEAPSLGIPVLVLRKTTERPEGIAAGCNRLVGTDPETVTRAIGEALVAGRRRPDRLPAPNPFGDGEASVRCTEAILQHFGRARRPEEFAARKAPAAA